MIKVGNIKLGDEGEYCGRPSPLGNPFPIKGQVTRKKACKMYDEWIHERIKEKDKDIITELCRLKEIHNTTGELTLLCFCSPLQCHCDTIKEILDNAEY